MPTFLHEAMRDVHFDFPLFVSLIGKVALAWILTFPISVERARDDRSAGLRTFPVVAASCCALVLLAGQVFGISSDQQTHILQGLVTGIIGAAVGYGRFEIAVVLSAFTTVTLYFITKYEMRVGLRDPITGEPTASLRSEGHAHAPPSGTAR